LAGFDPEFGPEPGLIFRTGTRICFEPLRTQDPGSFKEQTRFLRTGSNPNLEPF
jgi:hypothetical protein